MVKVEEDARVGLERRVVTPLRRTRLAAGLAAGATWVLIVFGGIVRVTGSGMGCPDWPQCYGRWVPPIDPAALIETGHRALSTGVALLVVLTLGAAWLSRRHSMPALRGAAAATLLIALQVGLGAWTVFTGNRGDTVVAHLLTALLTLGAITWVFVAADERDVYATEGQTARGIAWGGMIVATLTLLLAGVGGVVQVSQAGFACPGFPLCGGSVWPDSGLAQLHMVHRGLAVVVGIALVFVAGPATKVGTSRSWARAAMALFATQFLVGALQVVTLMPDPLRWLHLTLAAALWAATVGLAGALWRAAEISAGTERLASAHNRSRPHNQVRGI